jgi:hypothetical protein
MLYDVSYKKIDGFFWKKIKKVKGDFIANDIPSTPRVLILEDESRIEIPTKYMMFKFSTGRFIMIKQQMESEAGQQLPLNKG